jgi:hypothetical protein
MRLFVTELAHQFVQDLQSLGISNLYFRADANRSHSRVGGHLVHLPQRIGGPKSVFHPIGTVAQFPIALELSFGSSQSWPGNPDRLSNSTGKMSYTRIAYDDYTELRSGHSNLRLKRSQFRKRMTAA